MKIKRRTLLRMRMFAIRGGIALFVSSLWYLYAYTQVFTITSYEVHGTDEASSQSIKEELLKSDNKKSFYVLPRDKIFSYSNSLVVETVRKVVPETGSVTTRPRGLHTVKVTITELEPLFKTETMEGVDKSGIVFSSKKDIGHIPTLAIASSSLETVTIDGLAFKRLQTISPNFLENLSEFSGRVSSILFPVSFVAIDETGDVAFMNKEKRSSILFQKTADFKKIWSTVVSAIDTDPLKTKLDQNKDSLQYLDVRYGNKVFYKFGEGSQGETQDGSILQSHATSTQNQ